MKPPETTVGQFEVVPVFKLTDINTEILDGAIDTYRRAFAAPPYEEAFTEQEAAAALEYITKNNGDLMIGTLGGKAISLAGGYYLPNGTYYIEELAVAPDQQGNGYGRTTLKKLLETADADRYEIRTATTNEKSIKLYESIGFERELGTETAAGKRQSGRIGVDERIYLSMPPLSERERLHQLKRAAIVYPSGNTTAVIFDQFLDRDRTSLNKQIMQTWEERYPNQPEIEQCCFVTLPKNQEAIARVEMFGGEFCGNATRSAIWLLTGGQDYTGLIEVSGVDRPLIFNVRSGIVRLKMPLPQTKELVRVVEEGALVQLDGISQLVITETNVDTSPREVLMNILAQDKYEVRDLPAMGVTCFDKASNQATFCVWVKDVDTIFDETACGSGTSAIGIAKTMQSRSSCALNVIQPSGETIQTEAAYYRGDVQASYISGTVNVLYDGAMELS